MSPLTYVEHYLGDTTGRSRDGLGSSASSYHEINVIANGSYQYYFFLCTPRVVGKKPSSASSKSSGRSHPYPRTSPSPLPESLAISHLPHLHIPAALFSCMKQSSRLITTTTYGLIGTSSIDISPVGEHLEKRTSGLLTSIFVYRVKSKLFSLKTIRRKEASLD